MRTYLIIIPLILCSCFNEKSFIQADLSSKPKNNILQYDGIYSKVDTNRGNDGVAFQNSVAYVHPIRFFENRYFASSSGSYDDEDFQKHFKKESYKKNAFKNEGMYYVQSDSIYMTGKFKFYWTGKIPKFYIAHFRGYIKNKDTITDWKMIPPYPNIDFEANYYLLNRNQPAMYTFKPLKFDSVIDPNKLWIIEEQKKQKKKK